MDLRMVFLLLYECTLSGGDTQTLLSVKFFLNYWGDIKNLGTSPHTQSHLVEFSLPNIYKKSLFSRIQRRGGLGDV